MATYLILHVWAENNGIDLSYNIEHGLSHPLEDGAYFYAPPASLRIRDTIYNHPGGGFTFKVENRLMVLLQGFIDKFVGLGAKMQEVHEVEAKLLEVYKPVKAGRLVSVWLYVQKFGTERAKEVFGRDSYYRSKRELKDAGISLADRSKVVTTIDRSFFDNFTLSVPSPHVVNKEDDFRDSGNILNFVPKTSSNF